MEVIKMFLTPNRYSRPQTALHKVSKIAVHYVGNAGTSAKANRNYFESLKDKHIYASSHYIIGLEGEIVQCIPESEISYATNDANGYSISIENCHPTADGRFTDATRQSLIELCADICKRYKLNPLADIIRHYDVSGKKCPLYWVNHPEDFTKFKHEVATYMSEPNEKIKVETINLKVNGKVIKSDAIVHNSETYIKLRGLENADFVVGYDKDTKLRTLDNLIKVLPLNYNGENRGIESIKIYDYNFVSLRPIVGMLGYDVEYTPETKAVAICFRE